MGYFNSKGQYVPGENVVLDTHTARGAGTYNGTGVEVGPAHTATVTVATTAVGGTTRTLDVKIQTSEDNATWRDVPNSTFTQQTAVASQTLTFSGLSAYIRSVSTVGGTGTPTVTGTVAAVLR